jgi:alpha-beta hydrolase superfamily lysophospholipase
MRLLLALILLAAGQVFATPLQSTYKGLVLNANLIEPEQVEPEHSSDDMPTGRIFLLVHGTWGHNEMEIISGLQHSLAANGQTSLAINLSLGQSDRRGFMSCDGPINANHADAAGEIDHWVNYLMSRWPHVVLVAHSRGGNQAMLYNQQYGSAAVEATVLIAPMTWNQASAAQAYSEKYHVDLNAVLDQARQDSQQMMTADLLQCPQVNVRASSLLSYYATQPNRNTPDLLANTERPVLVFEGSEDPMAKDFAAQTEKFAANKLVTVLWIEGSDHFFRDLYIDDVVEHTLQWLQ